MTLILNNYGVETLRSYKIKCEKNSHLHSYKKSNSVRPV